MDMSQYRELFLSEARNHLAAFNELIVKMEQEPDNRDNLDELFRHAHSLKGMAATMEFEEVATLAHRLEDLLGNVRNGTATFSSALADILLEGFDLLGAMVESIGRGEKITATPADLLHRLKNPLLGRAERRHPEAVVAPADQPSPAPPQHQFRQSDSFATVRVKTELLDRLVAITGELLTVRHILAEQASQVEAPGMAAPLRQLGALVRDLRDEVFQARMLPFSFIAERFPRLVRDLARKQGKDVELQIVGSDCELDRGVLEEITEPLMHLLRNAVDHGLEIADERVAAGKPHNGTLTMTVRRNRDRIEISIRDDGRGMDPLRLVEKAVANGVVTTEEASRMSLPEIYLLTCAPGFSTAAVISDISGRGVGMDVVKTAVHKLGGVLSIDSRLGQGSSFTLQIPLTVSIIHGLLVRSGKITVAFPINTVERTIELSRYDIYEHEGRKVCDVDGEPIPLKNLNRLLGQPLPQKRGALVPALVVQASGTRVALLTDGIKGQQEIFVKPLGVPLSCMKWCSGGAILGDGSVVFVVDPSLAG